MKRFAMRSQTAFAPALLLGALAAGFSLAGAAATAHDTNARILRSAAQPINFQWYPEYATRVAAVVPVSAPYRVYGQSRYICSPAGFGQRSHCETR